MRKIRYIGLAFFMAVLTVCSANEPGKVDALFLEGARLYDDGQFAQAAEQYQRILRQGYYGPELFFNLGNALFRAGEFGPAILNYRRAQYLAPRDSDLNGNFEYAVQQADALPAGAPWVYAALGRLTGNEWAVLGASLYLLAVLSGIGWIIAGRRRDLWIRTLLGCALLGSLCLAGMLHWRSIDARPEWVALEPGQQALYAPLLGSTAHFDLPPGSLVREEERSGSWIKIRSGKRAGWIRAEFFAPVRPFW